MRYMSRYVSKFRNISAEKGLGKETVYVQFLFAMKAAKLSFDWRSNPSGYDAKSFVSASVSRLARCLPLVSVLTLGSILIGGSSP